MGRSSFQGFHPWLFTIAPPGRKRRSPTRLEASLADDKAGLEDQTRTERLSTAIMTSAMMNQPEAPASDMGQPLAGASGW